MTIVSNRSHPRLSTLAATTLAVAAAAGIGSIASPRTGRPLGTHGCASRPTSHPAPPSRWSGPPSTATSPASSAVAIDRFRTAGRHDEARRYIAALSVNLLLNAGWSWLFFRNHKLGTSALGAAALTVSSADLARRTAHAHPRAGVALLPYPLWCTFATVLSTDIWRLNRRQRMMPALLWFRRDLRLRDHPALASASDAARSDEVLACFVLDPRLEASSGQRRLQFLGDSLRQLRADLDGRLLVTRGLPEQQIPLYCQRNRRLIGAHLGRFRAVRAAPRRTGTRRTGFGAAGGDGVALSGFTRPRHERGRHPLPGVHALLPQVARSRVATSRHDQASTRHAGSIRRDCLSTSAKSPTPESRLAWPPVRRRRFRNGRRSSTTDWTATPKTATGPISRAPAACRRT